MSAQKCVDGPVCDGATIIKRQKTCGCRRPHDLWPCTTRRHADVKSKAWKFRVSAGERKCDTKSRIALVFKSRVLPNGTLSTPALGCGLQRTYIKTLASVSCRVVRKERRLALPLIRTEDTPVVYNTQGTSLLLRGSPIFATRVC